MKGFCLSLVLLMPAFAIDGTVVNRTTGKPAVDATVTLYRLGQDGMESEESVHTDAQGKFRIQKDVQGPRLLQTAFDGVAYNHMLPPGSPTAGLTLEVFNSSTNPGAAQVAQHMVLFEPGGGQMTVSESYIFKNDGQTTYNDPNGGTLKFYLPRAAKGIVQVSATAPQGMPIERAAEKTGTADVYKVDFAIKPGETRIDLTYLVPFAENTTFEGKLLYKGEGRTRLVTPKSVTLEGDSIAPLGAEPRTQANIYDVKGSTFKVAIKGAGALRQQETENAGSGPEIEQIMPRILDNAGLIMGLALAILALGFMLLYRAGAEGMYGQRGRR